MNYLGRLRGVGLLVSGEAPVGRVEFDLDGYVLKTGQVTGSGEIRMQLAALQGVFGRNDLTLRTDDGLHLKLRFSDRRLSADAAAAHVDVIGELPTAAAADWRR